MTLLLQLNLGFAWGVVNPPVVVAGPFCVESRNIYVPGPITQTVYVPGPQRQNIYTPGAERQNVCS